MTELKIATNDIIPDARVFPAYLMACAIAFLGSLAFCVSGLVSPQIAKSFGIDPGEIVKIDVLTVVGVMIGCALSGKLLSRLGCRLTLFILGSGLCLTQLVIALQHSLVIYGAMTLCSGFFWGLGTTTLSFLIVAAYQKQQKSDARLSLLNFCFTIGGMIGSSFFGVLVFKTDWRMGFLVASVCYLAIATIAALVRINEKLTPNSFRSDNSSQADLIKSSSKSITWGVVLVAFSFIAYVYIEYIVNYWWSPYLQLDLGYSVQTVGFIMSTWAGALSVGRLFFGAVVLPRVKSHVFIIGAALFTILGFSFFILFHSSLTLIFIWTAVIGLGCSSLSPTLFAFGLKNTKVLSRITTAFLATSGTFGGILSMITSASISAQSHSRLSAIYLGPVFCCFVIFFVVLAERYRRKNFA